MSVAGTSIEAYHELKEEGKLTERQQLAFETIQDFYEEKGYWPTPKEVHTFLALEKAHALAQFEGPNYVKPRITELIVDNGDENDPDLLEKEDARKQEYIEEKLKGRGHSEYESKSANPVKIIGYQSTLSSEDGEAAELKDDEDSSESEPVSDSQDVEMEIPYKVNDGSEVLMGPPSEAIQETDDLESVEKMLEKNGLLEKYEEEIEAARSDSVDSDSAEDEEVEVVETEMDYVFNTERDYQVEKKEELVSADGGDDAKDSVSTSDETNEDDVDDDDSEEEQQEILMEDGEVVG